MIKTDISHVYPFIEKSKIEALTPELQKAHEQIEAGTGEGSDFLGWVKLPENYDRGEFARIKKAAEKIKSDSKALVVIGIGGSYLGARALIELVRSPFYNALPGDGPRVWFAGNNASGEYL